MHLIRLETQIKNSREIVFDLSRSIDLHLNSMEDTSERAIAGVTSGLIGLDETVTWEARHFGIKLRHTSLITEMESPSSFTDEMVKGVFTWFKHKHLFEQTDSGTLMIDRVEYAAPLGPLGRIAHTVYLGKYLRNLLLKRNRVIKNTAEGEGWKAVLNSSSSLDL